MTTKPSRRDGAWAALLALATLSALGLAAHDARTAAKEPDAEDVYSQKVRPLLEQYCFQCHGTEKQKGKVRFDALNPDFIGGGDVEVWATALEMLEFEEMPPEKAGQPSAEEREVLMAWMRTSLRAAAEATEDERRGVIRRLNKAQYTNSLQDLLGLTINFGQVLPDDGKSEMGFTNNGEVLLASQLHLESYQAIARRGLEQAIVVGEKPEPTHYRVGFGKGVGAGLVAGKTGGYQSVPLATEDFFVDILDGAGEEKVGRDAKEQKVLDGVKRRVTVGFRGSGQDRFHTVDEGLVLYSGLPHKEVAPGAWQGPSPNMKLEMRRCFPQEGDFALRVKASRGYLVNEKKQLLVAMEEARPMGRLAIHPEGEGPTNEMLRSLEATVLGEWHELGPLVVKNGAESEKTDFIGLEQPLDLKQVVEGAEWRAMQGIEGQVRSYASKEGCVYLARVIEAPSARPMELFVGSDDGVWVYLNGEEVHANNARRVVRPDEDRVLMELHEGRNEVVVKIVNYLGGFGSYVRTAHDGTSAGLVPFDLSVDEGTQVLLAEFASERVNTRYSAGSMLPVDIPKDASAQLSLDVEADGYYQFDLVHPATEPNAMRSVRLTVDGLTLDSRPELSAEQVEEGYVVTTIAGSSLNSGPHTVKLGGPFFTGFSHLLVTRLGEDHPLVLRLEEGNKSRDFTEVPALRAFIGTRTDDGMDYKTFDEPVEVEASLGGAQVYTFHGRLENLPIPMPDSGDKESLSGILVLGVWNDHLVKSNKETGPPVLIEEIEFEAPYFPVWPPESHSRIFHESDNRGDDVLYTREILARFMERAFRRPADVAEIERYMAFWQSVRGDYEHFEHGVREVLIAVLCSPSFLFMAEPEEVHSEESSLSEDGLASRLAYFLWNSPPDEELRALAQAGRLREELGAEVSRLLDDPRSERMVRAFTAEWLRMDRLETMTINPNRFPKFTRFVKRDMAEETYQFVDHVLREDLNMFTLVDSEFAMLNQNLAEFYGVGGVEGIAFRAVPLPPTAGRGGLLSQGAFLAGHSDGNEPHPIKRAVWVKEKLLGQPTPPPPPNIPDLDPSTPGFAKMTLKEQLVAHRDNPSCHDCHANFDPYGIALEGYSAVGLLETMRKGRTIDTRVVLPDGTDVAGPDELKAYILGQGAELFAASLIEHLFAYAVGRDVGYADDEELQGIREQVRSEEDTLRAVVRAIVASPSFSER